LTASQKYRPLTQNIITWDKIEKYYLDQISSGFNRGNILALISYIQNNDIGKRVFGCTSFLGERLIVTIYNPAEWRRESLFIQYNIHTERWCFEYYPKPYEASEMIRYCDNNELVNRFCKFIEWLKW